MAESVIMTSAETVICTLNDMGLKKRKLANKSKLKENVIDKRLKWAKGHTVSDFEYWKIGEFDEKNHFLKLFCSHFNIITC